MKYLYETFNDLDGWKWIIKQKNGKPIAESLTSYGRRCEASRSLNCVARNIQKDLGEWTNIGGYPLNKLQIDEIKDSL